MKRTGGLVVAISMMALMACGEEAGEQELGTQESQQQAQIAETARRSRG